jgi:hypothetical protein
MIFLGLPIASGSCADDTAEPGPSTADGTAAIGPAGGTITTANGARLEVPPGALAETTTITITAFDAADELPRSWAPIPAFRGALEALPTGLQFEAPVVLTVPVSTPMYAGTIFPLLLWNEEQKVWEATESSATVAADGMTFSAEVQHFSGYGGGAFDNLLDGDADATMTDFVDWYRANILDLGDRKLKDNECFEVVGLDFDLSFEINGTADNRFRRVGRTSDYPDSPLIMVDYTSDVSNGHSYSAHVVMTVTNYYDCVPPDFDSTADRTTLEEGESTTVRASLTCAGGPLVGKTIAFDLASGPGEVNPGTNTTQSSGTATTTFTAAEDDAEVRALYNACELGDSTVVDTTVQIHVGPGDFVLAISFAQTTSAEDYYDNYSYSGSVTLATSDNGGGSPCVGGTGTFPVTGSGAAGDCTTTIGGTVTFSITGTVEAPASGPEELHLTVSPDFTTTKTITCPDDPPLTFAFLTGGESYELVVPVENGHTIDETITEGPITNHMVYVLTF